ncbi:MAG: anaerobic ribonucleoside-triphosphate reductase activating protein [Streptococcaceae bacterium]|nr:anaerobic ribonucleoside-triphosphate reductase activating protein [Streptococcaceae bacterium]
MRNPKPKEWRSKDLSQNYYADYKPFNFVDGEGVRNSLYVSGCLFACKGCYNTISHSFSYGKLYTKELENQIIEDTRLSYVQGLSLLGGEPFLNTGITIPLVKRMRKEFGRSKDIWCWTGYAWEELQVEMEDKLELLRSIDILVDGRFELAKKNLNLQFRGSSNQRIIDVQKSFHQGEIVIWDNIKGKLINKTSNFVD